MSRTRQTLTVSLGIFCYNESRNIGKLLASIQKQKTERIFIKEILIISSGSFDHTNDIVRTFARQDKRIKLIDQLSREGKSAAINEFLTQAKSDLLIIASGDIRLHTRAIEEICLPFFHVEVGMVGAHPIPVNVNNNNWGPEIKLLWHFHHLISLNSPKCGEMVAFRNVLKSIPRESAVDEATIEVLLNLIGYKIAYAPRSIVFNKGPTNFKDLIKQRRRIYAGHLWVSQKYHYQVSTLRTVSTAQVIRDHVFSHPNDLYPVLRLITVESISRLLGWFDFVVLHRNPYLWGMVDR